MAKDRILYIDDETDLLDLASSFFKDDGLALETCSDFNHALELIRDNEYDVIISDSKMPAGTGPELFSIIKREGLFKGKFILVTGATDNTVEFNQMDFDLIVLKPISFLDLIDKVKELLNLSNPKQLDSDQSL